MFVCDRKIMQRGGVEGCVWGREGVKVSSRERSELHNPIVLERRASGEMYVGVYVAHLVPFSSVKS